jgi:hypothetical protein
MALLVILFSVVISYKVNFDSSYVEFWTKGSMKYPRGGYLLRPSISKLPVQTARVKDNRTVNSRFLYDMGAGLNMMLSTDFLKDSSLLHKKRKMYTKEAEGLGWQDRYQHDRDQRTEAGALPVSKCTGICF